MKMKYGELYILPSFFSISNLFFGFISLLFSFKGRYSWAAIWIMLAAIMDGIDGIVARATKTYSEFGTELDSLSDAVSFGVAPAVLLYFWGLNSVGAPGIFFCFIYLIGGILRLARYNILQKSQSDRRHFVGLAIPSAAMAIASIIYFHPQPLVTREAAVALGSFVIVISLCMISTIKYRNFLHFNIRKKIDIKTALFMAVFLSCLIFYTRIFLLVFFTFNVVSGLLTYLFKLVRKKAHRKLKTKEISL